jgi:ATP-dependent DNA helicase DinG
MSDGGVEPYLAPGTDRALIDAYASLAHRAREASSLVEDDLVFVDVETTGFDPGRDRLVEIGAVRARGPEVLGTFRTFVDPGGPLPDHITRLTGITDEDLAGAPDAPSAVADLIAFAGAADLVGHNVSFDRAFIERAAGGPLPGRWLDSLELSRIALPRMRTHRLPDLADAFDLAAAVHRALDDAQATYGLWRVCLAGLELLPRDLVEALSRLAPDTDWPLREVLATSAARGRRTRAFDLKHLRNEAREAGKARPLPDAEEVDVIAPPSRDVTAAFASDGLLGRMYAGYEPRDAQTQMADAVLEAFGEQTHLAVEAGTGVGKSVAYLVPAARLALRNGVGVGVATRTNALLDQLMYRELPALAEALAEEGPEAAAFRYVALKGYEHYPCLRKLDRLLAEGETPPVPLADVAATVAWVAQSSWDDLDALNVHRNEDYRIAVTSVADECAKRRCRFYPGLCYVHGIRQRAQAAHVVVTNHSLLFNDVALAGGILPPLRYWVVDEAHSAEDQARDQLSRRFSFSATRSSLSSLTMRDRASVVAAVRAAVVPGHGSAAVGEDLTEALLSLAEQLGVEAATAATVLSNFAEYVSDVPELSACRSGGSERVTDQLRATGAFASAMGVGRSLVKRLTDTVRLGTELAALLEEAGEDLAEQRGELRGRIGPLAGQLDALASFVNGDDPDYVYVFRANRYGKPDGLVSARLHIGPALVADFFPAVRSAVFTSATLAVGDDFRHFENEVGLDLLPPDRWGTLKLDSPYDLENQMTVYVATDTGDPNRTPGWLDNVAGLLEGVHRSMGGSVLSLFTNRREMQRTFEAVVSPLAAEGIEVRLQEGPGSVKRLRQEFLAHERLSLFATRSFWEGFDAPGDTLRCVVLAKLPFPNPSDPVLAELKEREPSGHFERHALPAAALDLKQAVGRLIRSSADTGCVVIADSRLAGGLRYAPVLLDALPVRGVEMLPSEEIVEQIRLRFGRRG